MEEEKKIMEDMKNNQEILEQLFEEDIQKMKEEKERLKKREQELIDYLMN